MAAMMADLTSEQRETLRLAIDDAVYYRDPPVQCAECPPEWAMRVML
jgi:hypothetical protein